MSLPIKLRAPESARELNFVRSSWTKSANKGRPIRVSKSHWAHDGAHRPLDFDQLDAGAFMAAHSRHVDRLLTLPTIAVTVADPIAAPGTLAGWACFELGTSPLIVHYVYVGLTFRRMGVAKMLLGELPEGPKVFPVWTPVLEKIKLPAEWTWDPTCVWR